MRTRSLPWPAVAARECRGRARLGSEGLERRTSAADLAHRAGGADEVDLADAVAGPLGPDRRPHELGEVVIGSPGAEYGAEVELLQREQACAELAFGRHPHTVAVVAERLGDARDHADVAEAVAVAEPRSRLGIADGRLGLEGEHGVDAVEDLLGRDDLVHAPGAFGVERHELDEPQTDTLGAS